MKKMFSVYDLVHINAEMPEAMSHFDKDKDAIITKYSHNSCQVGNEWEHSYSLFIKGRGGVSWYHNFNLQLVEKNREDLLITWQEELKKENELHSDLEWIFNNGKRVLEGCPGPTASALGKCVGIDNMWGSRGEGVTLYANTIAVLNMAKVYLEKGDKKGWLKYCRSMA